MVEMADKKEATEQDAPADPAADSSSKGGTALKTKEKKKSKPKKKPPGLMPLWKVLLHNDDKNDMLYVVESIVMLTPLNQQDALLRMKEANDTGVALLLVTHKERAELYQEQFQSRELVVTIEPAE